MNLTLVFSRKYRWPGQYFSVWCLGNSQKLLTTNQFLVITIFFAMMNVSFFDLRFDLFSIIVKEVNQIGNNIVCFVSLSLYLYVLDKLETLPQLISFKFSLVPIKNRVTHSGWNSTFFPQLLQWPIQNSTCFPQESPCFLQGTRSCKKFTSNQ